MNQEPEHTGEELIRLRAENRSLAADLFLAKKEAHDWQEWANGVLEYAHHSEGCNRAFSEGYPCKCGFINLMASKPEPPK